MNTDDLDPSARRAYAQGCDPVSWAVTVARAAIDRHGQVLLARERDANACRDHLPPLTTEALACTIIGGLLDSGWKPPEIDGAG